MSNGVRTFKLQGGGYADVPEEKLDEWMRRMDKRGIQFETADVSADMQVGEPEVIKTPSPPAPAPQQPSMMDRFLGGAQQYGRDFAKAGEGLVRGLNQSLYQGGADEFAAGVRAAGGEEFGAALKDEQLQRDRAWDETPITYGAGRALGYLPGLFMGGPAGAGWKAMAARFGANTGQAGVNGFLSEDGGLEDRAKAAGRDMAIAAPFSGAGEFMTKAAPAVDKAGIALRRANAGGSAGELNATRMNQGLEHMQSGVDQDFADLGLASSWKPQSAYGVASKLENQTIPRAGQQMGDAIDAAGEAGVRGDWDSVRQSMDNSKRAAMRGNPEPTTSQRGFASEMDRIAEQELPAHVTPYNEDVTLPESPFPVDPIGAPPIDEMARPPRSAWDGLLEPDPAYNPNAATPRELQTKKNAFEAEGYPREGTVRLDSEAPRADAYRASAGAARAELGDAMQSQSFNDYYPDFKAGNETIEKATPIAAMAGNRAAANKAGSSVFNPLTLTMMGAGAAPGALMGSPATALAGGVGAYAANAIGRNYGQDLAGMGARATAAGMQGAGGLMQGLGRASGAVSGIAGASEPDRDMMKRFADQQPMSAEQSIDSGRGYMLSDAAIDALRNDRQALGRYAAQFAQAMSSNEPDAVSALITRLSHTEPDFRTQVLPALRARTGEV